MYRAIKKWKIFLQLMLLLSIFLISFETSAQHKVSFSFKDVPLKTVLKEVTQQTGYTFVYSECCQTCKG